MNGAFTLNAVGHLTQCNNSPQILCFLFHFISSTLLLWFAARVQRTSHVLFVISDEMLATYWRSISCQLDVKITHNPLVNYRGASEVDCVLIRLLAPGKRHITCTVV